MTKIIIILFFSILVLLFLWAINYALKRSKEDWNILEDLKQKANKVSTKEEIEEFHKEFVEKANKLKHNEYINRELLQMDGYLRGLYKQYKN